MSSNISILAVFWGLICSHVWCQAEDQIFNLPLTASDEGQRRTWRECLPTLWVKMKPQRWKEVQMDRGLCKDWHWYICCMWLQNSPIEDKCMDCSDLFTGNMHKTINAVGIRSDLNKMRVCVCGWVRVFARVRACARETHTLTTICCVPGNS